ncbi:MAG: hypothetical protein ACJAV1_000717 [Paraglaciecola sp.]|jgi:hypothetical protein
MPQIQAINAIQAKAQTLPSSEQAKFIETVETDLMGLHEGNFARYQIRPSEFLAWQQVWSQN